MSVVVDIEAPRVARENVAAFNANQSQVAANKAIKASELERDVKTLFGPAKYKDGKVTLNNEDELMGSVVAQVQFLPLAKGPVLQTLENTEVAYVHASFSKINDREESLMLIPGTMVKNVVGADVALRADQSFVFNKALSTKWKPTRVYNAVETNGEPVKPFILMTWSKYAETDD
jgi:hypothetical protein